ncbi:(Fe-S)-binding protein [Paenibacillus sp. MSJ-34]|nr:(Fe-S)-binding protein [Paenibacillus sp. MSJ-34]
MNTTTRPNSVATGKNKELAERMKLTLSYDELTNCMRCGFCQPACPTFQETGIEAASPRGRIALMKAVVDGMMDPDESFQAQMDLCLGCRACEPVCPADVQYGHLLEQTRDAIERHEPRRWWVRALRRTAFRQLFPQQRRMRKVGGVLAFYQRSGLRRFARKSGALRMFPPSMREMESILPDASSQGVVERLGTQVPATGGRPAGKAGMFRGCIMDVLFAETNVNTVKLLTEAGFDVVIPDTQNCCGALHAHSGEMEQAKELAKRNIRAFRDAGVDYIVSNAGGCGALLIEYDHLLRDDPEWAELGAWFAARVKDVSQIIMEKGRIPKFADAAGESAVEGRAAASNEAAAATAPPAAAPPSPTIVTYQDSCHLRNVMRVGNAPRDLMSRVEGIRFVELAGADTCCGSAGIYNLLQPQMSTQILDHKMEHVADTGAHYLLTSNPGCLLQMKLGIERAKLGERMQAVHIVDFLYDRLRK